MAFFTAKHTLPFTIDTIPQHRRLARRTTSPPMVNSPNHNPHPANAAGSISCCAMDHQGWHQTSVCSICFHITALYLSLISYFLRFRVWHKLRTKRLWGCPMVGIYEYDHSRLFNNSHYRYRQDPRYTITAAWNDDTSSIYYLYLQYLYTDKKWRCLI